MTDATLTNPWRKHRTQRPFDRARLALRERWKTWRRDGYEAKFDAVLRQIADHGPCGSSDVGHDEERSRTCPSPRHR